MAEATGYLNQDSIRTGIVEVIDLEGSELKVDDVVHYDKDLSGTKTYPYPKTYAGHLKTGDSDSVITRSGFGYFGLAIAALLI